jgi:hypothetical protein
MGNSHSAEAPRKAPQKLSKPRLAQRTSTLGLPDQDDVQSTQPAHFSNSYHVGRPLSAIQRTASSNGYRHSMHSVDEAASDVSHTHSPVHRSQERERRLSGIVRSNTSINEYESRRSMVAASVYSLENPNRTRANSMVQTAGARSFTGDRTISLPSQSRRSSMHHELPTLEPRSPLFMDPSIPQVPPIPSHISSEISAAADSSPRSPQMQQPGSATITRSSSEVSLNPLVRRRSIIQIPGVATRPPTPLASKSSFRHSVPPSPSPSRRNSLEVNARRHHSMLPLPKPAEPETRERVVTPCEEEYKQLGGMKFGSLRIMNASPTPGATPDPATPDRPAGRPRSDRGVPLKLKTGTDVNDSLETKIAQPKPTSSVTSPIIASLSRMTSSNKASKPHNSSVAQSPMAITSPQLEIASKPTGLEAGLFDEELEEAENASEVLNVKEVPHARPSASVSGHRSSVRKSETVTRSDSGFASTSSSNGSGKQLSKTDSGYGSSLSLRSLRRSKSKARTPSKKAPGSEEQSLEDKAAADTASPRSKKTDLPSSERSNGGLSFASSMSFSMLKTSKSREPPQPRPASRSTSRSRPKSGAVQQAVDDTSASAESKQHKLQRLWNSSRRKSMPAQSAPSVDFDKMMPLPQSPVSPGEQDTYLSIRSRHTKLRLEPSKDTLKTILSVGSIELQSQDPVLDVQGHTISPEIRPVTQVASSIATTVTVDEIIRPKSQTGRKTLSKPRKELHSQVPQQLKSRSSAPDFLKVDPSMPTSALRDIASMKGSKTPPPLSMRSPSTQGASSSHHVQQFPSGPASHQGQDKSRRRSYQPTSSHERSVHNTHSYSAVESHRIGAVDFAYHSSVGSATESARARRSSTGQQMRHSTSQDSRYYMHSGHAQHTPVLRPHSRGPTVNSMPSYSSYGNQHQQPQQVGRRVASNPAISAHSSAHDDPRYQGYGHPQQYRVLHSYDSPAYKNSPIWNH